MEYALVPLQKLDASKITFGKPKKNQYKGTNIPIYYQTEKGELTLYIKTIDCVAPFGLNQNTEMYNKKKVNGYSFGINLPYNLFKKIYELDYYLIDKIYENRVEWGLGEKTPKYVIEGYHKFGNDGKYKRIAKFFSYLTQGGVASW